MSKKKRNHIVPKVYLKAFCNEGSSTVNILLKDSKKVIKNVDIKDVAVEKNFYIQHRIDGTRLTKTEDELAVIENRLIKPTLTRFINYAAAPIMDGELDLPRKYKQDLVDTVVSQMFRGKNSRAFAETTSDDIYNELLQDLSQMRESERITQEQYDLVVENKKRLIKNGIIESSNATVLDQSLIKKVLMNRTIRLMRNSLDIPFVTSDEPVVFVNMKGESGICKTALSEATTIVYYPISPNVLVSFFSRSLLGEKSDDSLITLSNQDRDFIMSMNKYQYKHAQECVISNSSYALDILARGA